MTSAAASTALDGGEAEETITFNDEEVVAAVTQNANFDALFVPSNAPASGTLQPTTLRSESDYEMVDEDGKIAMDSVLQADEGIDAPLDDAEYELDELEAEIARELED